MERGIEANKIERPQNKERKMSFRYRKHRKCKGEEMHCNLLQGGRGRTEATRGSCAVQLDHNSSSRSFVGTESSHDGYVETICLVISVSMGEK